MGFSRQEYWSGLPFPSPGDLPDPGNPSKRGLRLLFPIPMENALLTAPMWPPIHLEQEVAALFRWGMCHLVNHSPCCLKPQSPPLPIVSQLVSLVCVINWLM